MDTSARVETRLAGDELGSRSRRAMDDRGVHRGSWVYPIKEDPDHKGAGCSGPAVQAGSGLTAPDCQFQKRSQLFIGVHNETLSIVAIRISDPDRSPARIQC